MGAVARSRLAARALGTQRAAVLVLGAAMVAGAGRIYRDGRGLTFFYDEWDFVQGRHGGGLSTFLEPHNEHLSVLPVAVYKIMFAAFGLEQYGAYRLLPIALHLICVGLVFELARRRLGGPLALVPAIAILGLGSAWEDLLWPFQIGFLASIAAGLGMLLALERRTRAGDIAAAVLLGVALASSSLGIPIAIGASVEVLWGRDRFRRAWVVGAPLALYALWYLRYGQSGLSHDNALATPGYSAETAAAGAGAIVGLPIQWGRVIAAGLAVWLARRLAGPGPLSTRLVMLLATAVSFWVLTGLARADLNQPWSSRYQYMSAVLIVLAVVETLRGVRVNARAAGLIALALCAALAGNLGNLRAGGRSLLDTTTAVRSELGALELVGSRADPGYRPDTKRMPQVSAGPYLAAVKDLGSPAYPISVIVRRPEGDREAADKVLVDAQSVRAVQGGTTASADARLPSGALVAGGGGRVTPDARCVALAPAGPQVRADLALPPGAVVTLDAADGARMELRLRRLGRAFPAAPSQVLTGGAGYRLALPRDGIPGRWGVRITSTARASACASGA